MSRSRVWIIQEVTLAKSVVVVCGGAVIDWGILMTGIIACLDRPWAEIFIDLPTAHYARVLYHVRQAVAYNQNDSRRLLFHVTSQCRWSKATNPRDKIYGLLGLASVGSSGSVLGVDYAQSVEDCYRRAVVDIIRYSGSLEILQLCRKPPGLKAATQNGTPRLPSWVPDLRLDTSDFQSATNLAWLDPIGLQSAPGIQESVAREPHLKAQVFCASQGSVEHDPRSDGDRGLIVSGMMLDKVSETRDMLAGLEAKDDPRIIAQFDYIREVGARTHTPWKYIKASLRSIRGVFKTQYDNGTDKLLLISWKQLAFSQNSSYPTGESLSRAFSATLHRGWLSDDPEKLLARHDAEWKRVLRKVEAFDRRLLPRGLFRQSKVRGIVASFVWTCLTFFRTEEVPLEGYSSKYIPKRMGARR